MSFYKSLHPPVFQGNLRKKKYFEGWYYKQVSADGSQILSVIPGISLSADPHSFVQIIDGLTGISEYITYPLDDFKASEKTLALKIGNSYFTDKEIRLDLKGEKFRIDGVISFKNTLQWKGNLIDPGIMGWYSWVPFMECYHGVVSLNHMLEGTLNINNNVADFTGGKGYIEKDWGKSFPECWVWAQANCFVNPLTSFMVSVAKIPWLGHFFVGHICFLVHNGVVYKFMTWNGSKIVGLENGANMIKLNLKGKNSQIEISISKTRSGLLKAPVFGSMERYIKESINATVSVRLTSDRGDEIFSGSSQGGGLEVVGDVFRYFN
jgi:tocopherol cyclase